MIRILERFVQNGSVMSLINDVHGSINTKGGKDDENLLHVKETVYGTNSNVISFHMLWITNLIRGIIDPEKPQTLEDLNVVSEENVHVSRIGEEEYLVKVVFVPTVPHCSLASLIGLCMRSKLEKCMPEKFKLDIFIKEGTHSTAEEINKQINDKERVAAAMENPNLQRIIDKCIEEEY
ncbi:hypothetical protein FSP39_019596 [Pinctada imbricata]|uniref:MIP18 family-like domain-containing protein n=1 Tax=Pinctada imbricata TaxID=66713 RepID=A0AA88Y5F8_PINIB|nr:hypothetical protein FSP39_019596 [Pinctada imbricata]